ncbi:MAG: phage major capsid protein [Gemmatimonadaceae bacterium]|jgi:HK97 family phage major capsid protein|nr:phage major capsid protein [Gemmatimonadaceae bacterium]
MTAPAARVGRDRAADAPFHSLGDFLSAVRTSAVTPDTPDVRLRARPSDDAVFLIPSAPLDSLLGTVVRDSPILSRVTRRTVTVGTTYDGLLPDESSDADGARFGGLAMTSVVEGGQFAYTWPRFRRVRLELQKWGTIVPAASDLVEDVASFGDDLALLAREEIGRLMERLVWTGLGGAQPIGVSTASSTIVVAIEGSQTIANTATHVTRNAAKLLARLRRPDRAIFLLHPDLMADARIASSGGSTDPIFGPSTPEAPLGTLHNRPVFPNPATPAVGTPGDFACVDLARYVLPTKGDVQQAMSVHAQFLRDEALFRFSVRIHGAPFLGAPVAPTTGTVTKSDAAVLAARS